MSDRKPSYVSRGGVIFLAILMLLTIVIPARISQDGKKAVWHWDVMEKAFEKDWSTLSKDAQMYVIFFGTVWAVAALSLILSIALRNLPLAVVLLIVVAAGVIVVAVQADDAFSDPLRGQTMMPATTKLKGLNAQEQQALGLSVIAAFLLVTGIRSRIGPSMLISLLQVVTAAALVGWMGLVGWEGVEDLRNIPKGAPNIVWGTVIYVLGMLGLMALAGVIAFFHALAVRSRSGQPTQGARGMALFAVWGMVGFVPGIVAVQTSNPLPILPMVGPLLVYLCYLMLALEAVTGLLASLCGIAWPAEVAAVAPVASPQDGTRADVTERLQRLDHLRAQGAISAEEYAQQRQRILSQL